MGRKEITLGRKEIHWAGSKIHMKIGKSILSRFEIRKESPLAHLKYIDKQPQLQGTRRSCLFLENGLILLGLLALTSFNGEFLGLPERNGLLFFSKSLFSRGQY